MRKIFFIPLASLLLWSCNGGNQTANTTVVDSIAMQDTGMHMDHSNSTIADIPPVPSVPATAKVYFKNLKNGQTVKSPLKVEMGVTGMSLDSAGPVRSGSGHHHLLIDVADSLPVGDVTPKDSTHLHFGNAEKEAVLHLTPGVHKLTLQYADGMHRSYGSKLATSIMVTVK